MLIKLIDYTGVWVPRCNYLQLGRYFMLPDKLDYTYIHVSLPWFIPTSSSRASFVDICAARAVPVALSKALLHARKR